VYLIGTPYVYFYFLHRGAEEVLSFGTAVTMSFLVFVLIDIFKLFAAALIGKCLMPVLRKDLYEY
jgi:biotin transporter BioY